MNHYFLLEESPSQKLLQEHFLEIYNYHPPKNNPFKYKKTKKSVHVSYRLKMIDDSNELIFFDVGYSIKKTYGDHLLLVRFMKEPGLSEVFLDYSPWLEELGRHCNIKDIILEVKKEDIKNKISQIY